MVQEQAKPSEVDPTPEPIWYFRSLELYQGKFPAYYDVSDLPGTKILQDNYEAIRDEILAFYTGDTERIAPNNIPYTYTDPGWRTHTLYAFGFKHLKKCADLPFLDSVVTQIPGMLTTTVSVLQPNTRIHAHVGASSGVIRTHLAISIPAPYPEVGIRVRGHGRGWEDGKLFGIEMAHRHLAWNNTDEFRIALTVDTVKDEYAAKKDDINGRCLALLAMQTITTKVPLTKKLPKPVVGLIHTTASWAVRALIIGQRTYLATVGRTRRRPAPVARTAAGAATSG